MNVPENTNTTDLFEDRILSGDHMGRVEAHRARRRAFEEMRDNRRIGEAKEQSSTCVVGTKRTLLLSNPVPEEKSQQAHKVVKTIRN